MDMFEFLANFDWISPLIALTETAIYGPGWTFYLDLDSRWTGHGARNFSSPKA